MDIFLYVPIESVKITAAHGNINITSFRMRTSCAGAKQYHLFNAMLVRKYGNGFYNPFREIIFQTLSLLTFPDFILQFMRLNSVMNF